MFESIIDNIPVARIGPSHVHGHGLFAQAGIARGDTLVVLDGQCVPWTLYEETKRAEEWNAIPGERVLVRPYRTKYFYINHSRHPNLKAAWEPQSRTVRVVARDDIGAGDELLLDYRDEPLPRDYLEGHGETYL